MGWDFEANAPSLALTYSNSQVVPVSLSFSQNARERAFGGSVFVPILLSTDRQQVVSVGYTRSERKPRPQPEEEGEAGEGEELTRSLQTDGPKSEVNGEPTIRHTISGTYSYTLSRGRERFRDRLSITLSGKLFREEGESGWRKALTFSWRESIRPPLEASQWVSLRFLAGWTDSEAEEDAFELGGPYGPFVLRGFSPGAFSGKQAVSLGVQYRFGLFSIERGLGGWPVFFDDVGARLFVDAGMAGDELNVEELKLGFGAELSLSVTLDYSFSATFLLGVAQGVGEAQPQLYFNVDMPFF